MRRFEEAPLTPACCYYSPMSATATPPKTALPVVPAPAADGCPSPAPGPRIDYLNEVAQLTGVGPDSSN